MKATELRIDNYVIDQFDNLAQVISIHKTGSVRLFSIHSGDEYAVHIDRITPIELTEDWLVKFGFENVTQDWYTDKCYRLIYATGKSFDYWISEQRLYRNEEQFISCVYEVHHLQNLIFALTGSELTLNTL